MGWLELSRQCLVKRRKKQIWLNAFFSLPFPSENKIQNGTYKNYVRYRSIVKDTWATSLKTVCALIGLLQRHSFVSFQRKQKIRCLVYQWEWECKSAAASKKSFLQALHISYEHACHLLFMEFCMCITMLSKKFA